MARDKHHWIKHGLRCTDSERAETVYVRSYWDGQRYCMAPDSFDCVPAYVRTGNKRVYGFVHADPNPDAEPRVPVFTPYDRCKREFAIWQFEETDTYSGEANYCWVNRAWVKVPPSTPDRRIVTLARRWAGWRADIRHRAANFGDTIEIRPAGHPVVLFASWHDSHGGTVEPQGDQFIPD